MDEQAAIQGELAERRKQCEVWAKAYHRASQNTLAWNSRLVVIAIAAAALQRALVGLLLKKNLRS